MAAPHFVAKKIGDHYELQRQDPQAASQNVLWGSIGGVLALCGLVRGGPLGWLAVFGGATMICRGLTGKNPLCGLTAGRTIGHDPGPSHPGDEHPTSQQPEDAVEEASMESFPSSDAPARSGVSTVGGTSSAPDVAR